MKGLILAFTLLFTAQVFGEDFERNIIAEATIMLPQEGNIKEAVIALYESEIKNENSKLSQEIARIYRDQVEGSGELGNPTTYDMLLISNGRGGYMSYGHTYLLGVPVYWSGSGMIEELIEYIVVNVSIDLDIDSEDSKITIVFEKMVSINY